MRTCVKMHGFMNGLPGIDGKYDRTEYDCFVTFNDYRDNLQTLKDYLKYYCGSNIDTDPLYKYGKINTDFNCAIALVIYYFRNNYLKTFENDRPEFIPESSLPNREPDQKTCANEIWANKLKYEYADSPKSAALMLYKRCALGKLSVEHAKAMVAEEFKKHRFSWNEVLDEFAELGGAYTVKYLRRL